VKIRKHVHMGLVPCEVGECVEYLVAESNEAGAFHFFGSAGKKNDVVLGVCECEGVDVCECHPTPGGEGGCERPQKPL
jgi:hypothetical protein